MLAPALSLTLLLLLLKGHPSQGSTVSCAPVVGRSGASLRVQPPGTQTRAKSVEWKAQLRSQSERCVILKWTNESGVKNPTLKCNHRFNNRLNFSTETLSLIMEAAQQQDSGNYILEVTDEEGKMLTHECNVSVFDPVGRPQMQQKVEALDGGKCQVTVCCSVPGDGGGDVSYTWYRGSEQIRELSKLEEQINATDSHVYMCNVSNPVSWASQTLVLSQACRDAHRKFALLHLLMIIVSLIITLFLGALTCFCVWRRKRKVSQPRTEELLTVYEDVRKAPVRSNQEQEQGQGQGSPGEGNTIYSMILSQPPASTSETTAATLYSVVHPCQKFGSKKRNPNPSFHNTIYEEVGKIPPKAENPA
ncbi:natural killer cell receptor 2B4 isoform X1 [Saccopteryx bilineata]|uniref:natural killer cell receptor 2B4 isoform X1 n=1 Tax=Saccopteryx bilineata TaxID=59482 RepID=UPI00338D6056